LREDCKDRRAWGGGSDKKMRKRRDIQSQGQNPDIAKQGGNGTTPTPYKRGEGVGGIIPRKGTRRLEVKASSEGDLTKSFCTPRKRWVLGWEKEKS